MAGEQADGCVNILIVEDDDHIAQLLEATLSMAGYRSERCADGETAVTRVRQGGLDLVLLDIMLPGLDGFAVMERIQNAAVPVIFLTAMQDVGDKVRGLRLGAEDYIVKPFEVIEVLARVEVVLRRAGKGQKALRAGDVEVDLARHTVLQAGEPVSLTPKEFDLLVFFMKNPNIAIPRERLLSEVWGYDFAGESRTVDVHVQTLRRKLGWQERLMTIYKLGYRLKV